MDLDVKLANEFKRNQIIFRVYRWKPYCISLGANQSFDYINIDLAQRNNIDVVKRPTGGRSILHSEELTYSVIYPIDNNTSAHEIYNQINLALKVGLIGYNSLLSSIDLEHIQPDFKKFYKENKSAVCFAVSAKSEINFNNKKLVGSAQRKLGKVILQHGSILCGKYHLKIVDYLNLAESLKSEIKNDIFNSTTDLKSVLNEEIDYNRLSNSLKKGFEEHFKIKFENNV